MPRRSPRSASKAAMAPRRSRSARCSRACPTCAARPPPAPRCGTAIRSTAPCRWGRRPHLDKTSEANAFTSSHDRRAAQVPGHLRHRVPQRHLPQGLPQGQQAGADPDHGRHDAGAGHVPAWPRRRLVPGLPPRDQTRQVVRPCRQPDQLRPAAGPVRQVPWRQAARLARRHPRQAHRRLHQHRQEALVSPAPNATTRTTCRTARATAASCRSSPRRRRSCRAA
jgi:hypothetical protein